MSNRQVYVDGLPFLQCNASTTFGNSGGLLVVEYGRVISIVTMGLIDSQNMNYAVPIQQLDAMQYGRETIANVQQPGEAPLASGKGLTTEQEINDSFDDADVIQFASGETIGKVQNLEDVDTFYFRTEQ